MTNKTDRDFVKIRSFLADNVDVLLENLSVRREAGKINSEDLFGSFGDESKSSIKWKTNYKKLPILDILIAEKNSLGLYVSGNPLEKYKPILSWAKETADKEDLHLILIDKIRKIFTKRNQMMFALEVTTPNPEEKLEGIIFPKNALGLSPKLEENRLFWVKGNVIEDKRKKSKKEDVVENDDNIQEYAEIPKLAIDYLVPFSDGVGKLYDSEEIPLPMNRVNRLNSVDWKILESKPSQLKKQLAEGSDSKKSEEEVIKNIKLSKQTNAAKILEIKKHLKKEPFPNATKVSLEVEKTEGWRKVKGCFWTDYNKIQQILSS